MPAQNIHVIQQDFKSLQEASEAFAILQKQFRYMQEHIDVENIIAKSLTADVIKAGAITADEMTVNELSAITANMGKITSGELYSAYIATSESGYPRVVIDPSGNYIGIYTSATEYMEIKPGITNAPNVTGYEGGNLQYVIGTSFGVPNYQSINSLFIRAGTDLSLLCGAGGLVQTTGWSQLYSISDGQTLADALNNLATAIAGAATAGVSTSSAGAGTYNGGIPIGTSLAVAGGGSVTWAGINVSSHSHTQN